MLSQGVIDYGHTPVDKIGVKITDNQKSKLPSFTFVYNALYNYTMDLSNWVISKGIWRCNMLNTVTLGTQRQQNCST